MGSSSHSSRKCRPVHLPLLQNWSSLHSITCIPSVRTMSVASQSILSEVCPQKEWQMLTVENVLFSNLVLLGLDPEHAERKYGCSLTRDMFRAPNVKGMEAVLHFLLSQVSSEAKDVRYPSQREWRETIARCSLHLQTTILFTNPHYTTFVTCIRLTWLSSFPSCRHLGSNGPLQTRNRRVISRRPVTTLSTN